MTRAHRTFLICSLCAAVIFCVANGYIGTAVFIASVLVLEML